MELQQRTWDMVGVRDSDEGTLEFWFNPETKSLRDCVVTAFNEGGYNCTNTYLYDVLVWLKLNLPNVFKSLLAEVEKTEQMPLFKEETDV